MRDSDGADHAVHLVRRTALAESIATPDTKPVLHGDNRSTLKATTTQYSHQRPVARVLCVDC